jgi:ubiquinone/menaquinone biosynthesis C-methylase UbiE
LEIPPATNALSGFEGNIERFSGYADVYDQYRPSPPAVLVNVMAQLAHVSRPALVVDLGSGTGLSTRYWADKAGQVIGIEPTADMRHQAQAQTTATNVSYREGFSHQTGLPDHCAEFVTCSQALHWMEPQATFEEVRRILRPGGLFAAVDYDWPPTTGRWEADAAYETCNKQVSTVIERDYAGQLPPRRWSKDGHLQRMRDSGCFRFTKEIVLHHLEPGNAERLIGLLMSQPHVMMLIKGGYAEAQLGIDVFREICQSALGDQLSAWYWSARVRLGIT